MTKVGSFELVELSPGRWSVFNELTQVTHITYGTAEEVEERARRQTTAWKRRMATKSAGAAWRKPPKEGTA